MRNASSLLALLILSIAAPVIGAPPEYRCTPTAPDAEGPFYRAGAPERSKIGEGYVLMGEVKSAVDCAPIAGAKIEAWMAGPDGRYDDRLRATFFSREDGRYVLESPFPGRYGSRPPHIHLLVTAPGFAELITQHYPVPGSAEAVFDLILLPSP
jgi:protocatechuate 3,4-dioxygenase beta subunit